LGVLNSNLCLILFVCCFSKKNQQNPFPFSLSLLFLFGLFSFLAQTSEILRRPFYFSLAAATNPRSPRSPRLLPLRPQPSRANGPAPARSRVRPPAVADRWDPLVIPYLSPSPTGTPRRRPTPPRVRPPRRGPHAKVPSRSLYKPPPPLPYPRSPAVQATAPRRPNPSRAPPPLFRRLAATPLTRNLI
jgi:hypothetical protein